MAITRKGTSSNDYISINSLESFDTYNGGKGDDIYVISKSLNRNITINDTSGANQINLTDGMIIKSTEFLPTAVRYTVTNVSGDDYTVTVVGNNNQFIFGKIDENLANPLANTVTKTFAETATLFGIADSTVGGTGTVTGVVSATSTGVVVSATTYTIVPAVTTVTEGNSVAFTVTSSSVAPAGGTTLTYQISGVGYNAASAATPADDLGSVTGTVTIAEGQTTATVTLSVSDDGVTEGLEAFNVVLLNSNFATVATSSAVVVQDGAEAGKTYTLTTSSDNKTGTSGDDYFDASLNSSNSQTLNSGDSLNGGAGNDSLSAVISTSSVTPKSIKDIEEISATFTGSRTLNLSNASEVTSVINTGSDYSGVISNIRSSSAVTLTLADTDQDATFSFLASAVSGSSDSATITVSNVTDSSITIPSVETLNVISSDSANSLDLIATTTQTLNVSGSFNIDLTKDYSAYDSGNTKVTKIDASSLAAGLSVETGGLGTTSTTVTVLGGTGNDDIDVSGVSGSALVTAGTGNDTVTVDYANIADTITGGDGTDTLKLEDTAANLSGVTGFEIVTFTNDGDGNVAQDMDNFGGSSEITTVNSEVDDSLVITDANAALTTLNVSAASGDPTLATVTLDRKSDTTADSLTVNVGDTVNTTALDVTITTLTAADEETLTINSSMSENTITTLTAGDLTSLTLTGTKDLEIGTISSTLVATVNASAAQGNISLDISNSTVAATITGGLGTNDLTGGSGSDSITGGSLNDSIDSGDGNDTVSSAAGVDTITAGNGNDSIDAGAGNDTINAGTGNDTITAGSGVDTVTGGAGNDTFVLTDEAVTDTITDFGLGVDAVSGTYTTAATLAVTISDSSVTALDLSTVLGTSAVASVTGGALADTITGGSSSDTIAGGLSADSITAGAGNDSLTGDAGADTIDAGTGNDTFVYAATADLFTTNAAVDSLVGGAGTDVLSIGTTGVAFAVADTDVWSRIGTVESIIAVANSASVTVDLDSTAATAGIVTVDLSAVTASTGNTIDVSEYTAVATTLTGSTTGATSITGGSVADTITGGSANDTIDGGSGADSITAGSGNDSITGGTGADTIDAGAGADTLVYALTADLFTSSAAVDSITGGAGTDVLSVGTTGTAFAIADTDVWSRVTTVESIVAVANTAAVTVDLDSTAETAGIVTVNLASVSVASGNIIDASEYTSTGTTLTGGSGNTAITGGASADTIVGGAGVDTITGGLGNDSLTGAAGIDTFTMTAADTGTDTITDWGNGADVLTTVVHTGAGYQLNVTINDSSTTALSLATSFTTAGSGVASVTGGTGADTITGGVGNDTLAGSAGADSIVAGSGVDLITGGTGADTVTGGAGADTFVLTTDNAVTDTITDFGLGADILSGTYTVAAGLVISIDNSSTTALDLSTTLGTSATATVTGGTAADTITGGSSADTITGGVGNDSITGGLGADTITGGFGDDTFVITATDTATDTIDNFGLGNDKISGTYTAAGTLKVTIFDNATALDLSSVLGTSAVASVTGGNSTDSITGGSGNDTIAGGSGADTISGGLGNDSITGGVGADSITGGSGADVYIGFGTAGNSTVASADTMSATIAAADTITFATGSANTVDQITDYVSATDSFDVTTEATAPTNLVGLTLATALTSGTTYVAYGNYVSGTGVFTISAAFNASTADDAIVAVGDGTLLADNHTGYVVLTGLTQALVAADFV